MWSSESVVWKESVFVPPYPLILVALNKEYEDVSMDKRYHVMALAQVEGFTLALVLNNKGQFTWIDTKDGKFRVMQMQMPIQEPIDLSALLKKGLGA